ncbi:MAG: HIRAN domain-containing protein [Chitinophagales bacterium]
MTRKNFLKQLLTGGAGVAMVGIQLAKAGKPDGSKIYHNYLRGLYYYDFEKVANYLSSGNMLKLKREPDNPYDKYAIEVFFGKYKLGYLPRAENKVMANLMD